MVRDDVVYLRSYRGPTGRWYREALADSAVAMHVDGRRLPARAEPAVDPARSRRAARAFATSTRVPTRSGRCSPRTSCRRPCAWCRHDRQRAAQPRVGRRDVPRRVQAPAARPRRAGDDRLGPLPRRRRRAGGRDPRALPAVQAAQAGAPAPGRAAAAHQHALHQHHQPGAGAGLPRRRGPRAAHSPADPLERGRDGPPGEHQLTAGIGGHLATYASAATLYEVGFNWFFKGRENGGPGDQVFYQGHAAPGIYARAFLEGRHQRGAAGPLPARDAAAARPVLVPAPAPHAGLLGVPDGLDGPRPDRRDLPGAVQPLPPEPRPASTRRARASGRSWATARPTSPRRSARFTSPPTRAWTT